MSSEAESSEELLILTPSLKLPLSKRTCANEVWPERKTIIHPEDVKRVPGKGLAKSSGTSVRRVGTVEACSHPEERPLLFLQEALWHTPMQPLSLAGLFQRASEGRTLAEAAGPGCGGGGIDPL